VTQNNLADIIIKTGILHGDTSPRENFGRSIGESLIIVDIQYNRNTI